MLVSGRGAVGRPPVEYCSYTESTAEYPVAYAIVLPLELWFCSGSGSALTRRTANMRLIRLKILNLQLCLFK